MSLRRPSLLLCRTAIQALAAAEACTSAAAHGAGRVIQEAWSCPPFALFGSAATARPLVSLADFQPCSGRQRQGSQPLPHQPLRTSFTATPAAAQSTGATHPAQTLAYLQHSCLPASATLQSSQQRPFARQASVDADDARRRHAGKPAAEAENPSSQDAAHSPSGWTRREVWNAPNAISMARLLSGPIIASWIVAGKTDAALLGLVISGWSDWLDGFVARRFDQQSTLGSYLDPLADKVLICSAVAALGIQGTLPGYLAAVIIGRDVFLIGASFAARASSLGWQRVSIAEFFRIAPKHEQVQNGSSTPDGMQGAGSVAPLSISKLNTVLQLATVAGFLLHAYAGWPPTVVLDAAAAVTVGTTVLSGAAYVQAYRRGRV